MKKLLKAYGLNSDMQYCEMIIESFNNGQIEQAKKQFLAMPKINRLQFLEAVTVGNWNSGLSNNEIKILFNISLK